MSNHLLVQLQRQHILLSYFKTLSVGPVWGSNPRPPAQQTGALPTELTRRRYHCDKQYSIKGSVANAPANFKTVTWTIPFIRNQWFLKHDWIKLHYSQLPTTIIKITKWNIKWQKTAQNVPDSLDRRSTGDAAEKRSQHDKLHNITVLFVRKFQYVSTDARGLSLICR